VLSLAQCETERLLAERLTQLGGRVERGVTLTALEQDDAGVTVTLAHDGTLETARVAWVVGCDGAHSTVRHALGLPFEGAPYDEAFVLAEARLESALPTDEFSTFLAPDGIAAIFPLPGDRVRIMCDAAIERPTVDDFVRLLRERGAPPVTIRDPGWLTSFRIHRRIAGKYRVGRCFVAGDAAHIHSPVGGQGMNTGMQDAFNLAWKLALVAGDHAHPALLDTYELERRPIAAATLHGTDLATKAVTLRNPVAREIRNRLAALLSGLEVVQKRLLAAASEVAIGYRSSPIVGEHRLPMTEATIGTSVGDSPSVREWLDFGAAPRPGDRAPDVAFEGDKTLHALFRHPRSTLLLFSGGVGRSDRPALDALVRRVRARWDLHVESVIVAAPGERPASWAAETLVVSDPQLSLHRRFGAQSPCLFLVRPDGYVGFRSQPAAGDALEAHLGAIFR